MYSRRVVMPALICAMTSATSVNAAVAVPLAMTRWGVSFELGDCSVSNQSLYVSS